MTTLKSEKEKIREALDKILKPEISLSHVDRNLKHDVSPEIIEEFNKLQNTLNLFSSQNSLEGEEMGIQTTAAQFRNLILLLLADILDKNEDSSVLSPKQFSFQKQLQVLGAKLQSYNLLLVTAKDHASFYNRLREASIFSEIYGDEALKLLRNSNNVTKLNNIERSDIDEKAKTTRTYADLNGVDDVIKTVSDMVESMKTGFSENFEFFIFYGIPGTGKTALAECIASDFSDGVFYKFDQAFFSSPYYGVTESRLRNIFKEIQENPKKRYTILIDEADFILGVERQNSSEYIGKIKMLMQTEITGTKTFSNNCIIIAITNYINRIDQTIYRRASKKIEVLPPSPETCLKFLEQEVMQAGFVFSDEYKRKLRLHPKLIYTNSDMSVLAKNIKSTFLEEYTEKDDRNLILFTFKDQDLLYFSSESDATTHPVTLNNGFAQENTYPGTFTQLKRAAYEFITNSNKDVKSVKKCYAPSIKAMNTAFRYLSRLSVENASIYKDEYAMQIAEEIRQANLET